MQHHMEDTMVYFALKRKIWQSGFYWPSMYDDTKNFIRRCPNCQRHGEIKARDSMPLNYNLQVELFDVWGIDYMGPFVKSQGCEYILVTVDYVSKWVEAMSCRAADAKHARKMFHEIIFPRFGTPRMVISDGGSHFIDSAFRNFLKELGTISRLRITLRPAVKQKHPTNKSRIFCKRP